MFPFWRVPEEVEVKQDFGHIKFPTFLNDIFSKVRLFIFDLKPFLDSPLSWELNQKKNWLGQSPASARLALEIGKIALETFSRQIRFAYFHTTKVISYLRNHFFWRKECSELYLAKQRLLISVIVSYTMTDFPPHFTIALLYNKNWSVYP